MRSGKTPLIRARKLEKIYDVGEIYLKLEGQNPTGHKHDRIAEVLVRSALAHNHDMIIAYGSQSYLNSIKYFSELYNIRFLIPMFKNQRWKKSHFKDSELIDYRNIKNADKMKIIKNLSIEKNAFVAAEGFTNTHISLMLMESLIDEVTIKLDYDISSLSIQLGYGHTMTGMYNSFLKGWMEGKIKDFPTVFCGTWEDINEIYKEYKGNYNDYSMRFDNNDGEFIPKYSFYIDKNLVKETLKAVTETNGHIIQISEEELKNASRLARKTEAVKISHKEAYPLAAFINSVERGKITKGKHVIILNEAKTQVRVDRLENFDELSKEELTKITRNWLVKYSDSHIETIEAIENAMEKGHILLASRDGEYEGICIIVYMGFDNFIPSYHLAYIGTSDKIKGRGIGSELIQRAIDLTDGNISLHVDLDNKNAKKVYEKYGFRHMYNRMIYKDK